MGDDIIIDNDWQKRLADIQQKQVVRCGEIYTKWLHIIGTTFPILAAGYVEKNRRNPKNSSKSHVFENTTFVITKYNGKEWKVNEVTIASFENTNDYVIIFRKLYEVCKKIHDNYYEEVCAYYDQDEEEETKFKHYFNQLNQLKELFVEIKPTEMKREEALAADLLRVYTPYADLLEQNWGINEHANRAIIQDDKHVDIIQGMSVPDIAVIIHPLDKLDKEDIIVENYEKKIKKHKEIHGAIQSLHAVAGTPEAIIWESLTLDENFSNILGLFQEDIKDIQTQLKCDVSESVTCIQLKEYNTKLLQFKGRLFAKIKIVDIVKIIKSLYGIEYDDDHEVIMSIGKYHADFKESLFPFRTVMNFRTIFGGDTSKYAAKANSNFEELLGEKQISSFDMKNLKSTQLLTLQHTNGKYYGPYYQVLKGGSGLAIENDIKALLDNTEMKKKHYIYSAYGYSGSGKTHDLIEDSSSVLARVIENIKIKGKYKLHLFIYDLYGEIADDGCIEPNEEARINYTDLSKRVIEDITLFKPQDDKIVHHIISKEEHQNESEKLIGIMKTYFNDYKYTIDTSDVTTLKKITDLVNQINEHRKNNFVPNDQEFIAQKYHIRETPNNTKSSRSHLFIDMYICDASNPDDVKGKVTILDMGGSEDVNAIQRDYFTKYKIKRLSSEGKIIYQERYLIGNLKPWLELYNNYKNGDKGKLPEELIYFILKNDYYIVRELDVDIRKATSEELTNKLGKYKAEDLKKELESAQTQLIKELTIANGDLFEYKRTEKPITAHSEIMVDAYTVIFKDDKDSQYNEYFKKLTNILRTPFNLFAQSIIRRVHCPLRFQGNYIMATLKYLKWYANELVKNKTPPTQDYGLMMNALLCNSMMSRTYDEIFKQKFVLLINNRLDHLMMIEDENPILDNYNEIKRHNNYYRDLLNVLDFSHCVNPFSIKVSPFHICPRASEELQSSRGSTKDSKPYRDDNLYIMTEAERTVFEEKKTEWETRKSTYINDYQNIIRDVTKFADTLLKNHLDDARAKLEKFDKSMKRKTLDYNTAYSELYSYLQYKDIEYNKVPKYNTVPTSVDAAQASLNEFEINITNIFNTKKNEIVEKINSFLKNTNKTITQAKPTTSSSTSSKTTKKLGSKTTKKPGSKTTIETEIQQSIEEILKELLKKLSETNLVLSTELKTRFVPPTRGGGIYIDISSLYPISLAIPFVVSLALSERVPKSNRLKTFALSYTLTSFVWLLTVHVDEAIYAFHLGLLYIMLMTRRYIPLSSTHMLGLTWAVSLLPFTFYIFRY